VRFPRAETRPTELRLTALILTNPRSPDYQASVLTVRVYTHCTYLLITYQDEPCGSQGPRHTQQNSALQLWFLQTIWLQPPSFSIVTRHLGHSWKIKRKLMN
jgi:hypothetical protein